MVEISTPGTCTTQHSNYHVGNMKVLSINFLTCAVKACKSSADSYPLHPKDAELVQDDIEVNAQLLINLLPRIDWTALTTTATEVRIDQGFILPIC